MTTHVLGAAAPPRYVGQSVQRREDPRLLTGHGTYIDDIVLPGMVHAAFLRSPLAHARIVSIDTTAARALPGVVAVWTGEELNGDTATLAAYPIEGVRFPIVAPLAAGDVRFAGDPVAIVVAEDRYIAEDACELIEVEYDPLPAVIGREEATRDAALVHPELGSNVAWSQGYADEAAIDAALAGCAHVITETIHQHRYLNVPMEPRGLIASWQPFAQELTVHVATQMPHADRAYLSHVTGVPENHVRVIMNDVGGGFGAKAFRGRDETAVVLASRRLARSVKWIEDRQENLMASNSSRDEQATVTVGVDADGVIQAMKLYSLADLGAYPQMPPHMMAGFIASMFPGPYKFEHFDWSARTVYTNTCGLGAYRGPWMMETVTREIMIDIVAAELGIDPAEFRRINTVTAADLPYTTASGAVYDHITPDETFEAALELIGYSEFRERQAKAREEGRHLGIGISHYVEPTAPGYGGPLSIEAATVRVEPSGKVHVLMGTGGHGQSLETTMIQIVADELGIPIDDVTFLQGDTSSAPAGGGTGGSRSAVVAGNVAIKSASRVREKVLSLAGHLLEAAPEDLEIEQGTISVKGSPQAQLSFSEVAGIAYNDSSKLPPGMDPGLEDTSRYAAPPVTYANSTQVCIVEVDVDTGLVKFLDYVIGGDCGVIINPMVVDGQVAGGVAQGIGGVLLEHLPYDADGNPLAITFKDYLMPTTETTPDFRYVHKVSRSATPGGYKGVGEGGAIGAPPAVVNAIADALSHLGVRRVNRQPLGPTQILQLIKDAAG